MMQNRSAGERLYIAAAAVMLLFGALAPAGAQNSTTGQRPDIDKVADSIDRLYRHESSHTTMEMEIHTPHWDRTLKLEAWSEGMHKTLIRILKPQKERGMGTLRINNDMWNYLPNTNKVMKIPSSMMMGSWMGSDFKNNDLVKEFTFTEDYSFEYFEPSDAREDKLYLKCTPKPDKPIVWGYVLIAVDKKSLIPEWEKYYDEHDKLMRTMNFRQIKDFDGALLPSIMELIPQTEEDSRTILRYIEAEFDIPLTESVFTLRNLRTFRK
ncbi:MAG: outer membrane lipoprotein-sorting protein [Spirochaetales bacterium]|nr:outer membrane lipoprotein-sorting protein [Spirochaetales bacterium]